MNLTVGPLPPAVYWRRRLAVLVGFLLVVGLITYSCYAGPRPVPVGGHPLGLVSSSGTDPVHPALANGGGPQSTPPSSAGSAADTPTGPDDQPIATDAPPCSDAQMSLTALAVGLKQGAYLDMLAKNISTEACTRDVGGGPQELHVLNAAQVVVWSSNCRQVGSPAPDVRTFGPGIESHLPTDFIYWDGYASLAGCRRGGPVPNGTYDLVARLGTLVSAPVPFTVG